MNQGVTKLPRAKPDIRKMYFSLDTPKGPSNEFQRYAYQLINSKSVTLIQYLGDEKVVIDFAHGNTKVNPEKKYVHTCPYYLNTSKVLVKNSTANVIYKKAISSITCDPESVPV